MQLPNSFCLFIFSISFSLPFFLFFHPLFLLSFVFTFFAFPLISLSLLPLSIVPSTIQPPSFLGGVELNLLYVRKQIYQWTIWQTHIISAQEFYFWCSYNSSNILRQLVVFNFIVFLHIWSVLGDSTHYVKNVQIKVWGAHSLKSTLLLSIPIYALCRLLYWLP